MSIEALRDLAEVLRDEMVMRDRIVAILREGPKTVPDVAVELGFPSREVTLWMMAMRRYGLIEELAKDRADDYYQYKLAE